MSDLCGECTFGALYNIWGILWRPLLFSLHHNGVVIDSICRLHNFIIKYDMEHNIDPDETVNYLAKDLISNLNSIDDHYIGILYNDQIHKKTRYVFKECNKGKRIR